MSGVKAAYAGPVRTRATRVVSVATSRRGMLPIAAFVGTTLLAAVAAYFAVHVYFAPFDDEGGNLIGLMGFLDGGRLYDEVYSPYGPVYFFVWGAAFELFGGEITHNAARVFVGLGWVSTSLLLGVTLARATGNWVIGVCAQAVSFGALLQVAVEPLHPGGLLVFLLFCLIAAAWLVFPRHPAAGMALMGAAAAATAAVKINVGSFALISLAYVVGVTFPSLARNRVVGWSSALAFIGVPLLLMAPDLHEPWARQYALAVVLGALALVVVTGGRATGPEDPAARRWLVSLGLGVGITAVLVVLGILAAGTSLDGLIEGVLIEPLSQGALFTRPLSLPGLALVLGVLGLATAIAYGRALKRGRDLDGRFPLMAAFARLSAGVVLWLIGLTPYVSLLSDHSLPSLAPGWSLALGLPLAWLAAVPPGAAPALDARSLPRLLIPALAILQTLHAYPVAGAQVHFAAVFFVPVGALCLVDGWTALHAWNRRQRVIGGVTWKRSLRAVATLALLAFWAIPLLWSLTRHATEYNKHEPAVLSGATNLRIPGHESYEWLAASVRQRCNTFLGLPGLNSLYLFAHQRPPTWLNVGNWAFIFEADRQRKILQRVRRNPGLCVVRNDAVLGFWASERPVPNRPLLAFIEGEFETAARRDGYEVLVRKR